MTTIEKLETRIKENAKLIEKLGRKLDDAERVICAVVPKLNKQRRLGDRLHKQLLVIKREARRKPQQADAALNDSAVI